MLHSYQNAISEVLLSQWTGAKRWRKFWAWRDLFWSLDADLKSDLRMLHANAPAWYGLPSMHESTVRVSCTRMPSSLSRLPSILRSLMLADAMMTLKSSTIISLLCTYTNSVTWPHYMHTHAHQWRATVNLVSHVHDVKSLTVCNFRNPKSQIPISIVSFKSQLLLKILKVRGYQNNIYILSIFLEVQNFLITLTVISAPSVLSTRKNLPVKSTIYENDVENTSSWWPTVTSWF